MQAPRRAGSVDEREGPEGSLRRLEEPVALPRQQAALVEDMQLSNDLFLTGFDFGSLVRGRLASDRQGGCSSTGSFE